MQSVTKWIGKNISSINHSINWSISQSINESVVQSFNSTFDQSVIYNKKSSSLQIWQFLLGNLLHEGYWIRDDNVRWVKHISTTTAILICSKMLKLTWRVEYQILASAQEHAPTELHDLCSVLHPARILANAGLLSFEGTLWTPPSH